MYRKMMLIELICIFSWSILQKKTDAYVVPEPRIEILSSKGIQISIPDSPGVQLFGFHGNLNAEIGENEAGEISGEVYRAKDGRWTLQKSNVLLQGVDVIHYWIYVQVNDIPYKKRYVYNVDLTMTQSSSTPTPTEATEEINTERKLIFYEEFNTKDFYNKSIWSREIKMPLEPDYEFCVYHNDNHNDLVTIKDGKLKIKPLILEEIYGENVTAYGKLRLVNCTSNDPNECTRQAVAFSILPPIISARLHTKYSFSFQYGKIEIRAKLPEGDWLYPELWLEPRFNLYGANYASGRVFLGLVRGNENLINIKNVSEIFDSRKLEFGLRAGSPTMYDYFVEKISPRNSEWNKDFHVYTTTWTSNGFIFHIDGQHVGNLAPKSTSQLQKIDVPGMSRMAPFDQEFYISIGLGVGGVRIFPDDTISSGYLKPCGFSQ